MSRVGKKPITVPSGVEVTVNGKDVTVSTIIIAISTRLITAAASCVADNRLVLVNNILKYVIPYVKL